MHERENWKTRSKALKIQKNMKFNGEVKKFSMKCNTNPNKNNNKRFIFVYTKY